MTSGYKSGFRTARRLGREDAKTGEIGWVAEIVARIILPVVALLACKPLIDRYVDATTDAYRKELELSQKAHARAESSNE